MMVSRKRNREVRGMGEHSLTLELISSEDDLKKAIRAILRDGEDETRVQVVEAARSLKLAELIPDNWNADGSLKEGRAAWDALEQRDTANDVFIGLESVLIDLFAEQYSRWSVWVQDWCGGGETGYTVIYQLAGDLFSAPFFFDDESKITIDTEAAVKVRPITCYVERQKDPGLESRKRKAEALMRARTFDHRTFPASEMELREADDGVLNLTGYASVTETPYDVGFYTERIVKGAFKRSLGEDPDVQLLVNHEGLPLARTRSGTMSLVEDSRGLKVEARLDAEDPDVQSLARKMKRGDIDQMSFAFIAREQEWNSDFTERAILDAGIHRGDVSVVNQGANPATVASVRSREALRTLQRVGIDGVAAALQELRAGKALSASTMEVLTQVLELVADADEAVDRAQPLLADLMGVPNPDEPGDDDGDDGDEERSQVLIAPSYAAIARAKRDRLMRAA
jgi:HK97 family phage prohead protease